MKHLLLISEVFPPEPVVSASISMDIYKRLSKISRVTVVCPRPTRPQGFRFDGTEPLVDQLMRVDSYTCPASSLVGRMRESFSFGRRCAAVIREKAAETDGIYLNAWPLFAQYLIVREARRHGIPTILHVHDVYPESLLSKIRFGGSLIYRILLPIDRYIMKKSSAILALSEQMKQLLIQTRGIEASKVTVVPNWQDPADFISYRQGRRGFPAVKKDRFTMMYLGNNGPLAGVDLLIRSFARSGLNAARLIVAGSGSRTESCIQLARSFPGSDIEFLPVPKGMVPVVQARADVLLLPVMKQAALSSVPSKLPAYMFSAKPVIGSLDAGSDTARAIRESGCGLVVAPDNEDELIRAMREAAQWSAEQLAEKGNAGFSYAMKNFSPENLNKIVNLIERLLHHENETDTEATYRAGGRLAQRLV